MSLHSAYELSTDQIFRGKVIAALAKIGLTVASLERDQENERRVQFAKEVLKNIHHYAERLYIIVAAHKSIDTSSTDAQIEQAVKEALLAIVND